MRIGVIGTKWGLMHVGAFRAAGVEVVAVLVLTHAASPEPGLHGGWSLLGEDGEEGFSGGFIPEREGRCVAPVRRVLLD
ncbi:MAG TPA: hypothetical protein VFZ09_24565 [Archangium sp.]|uniref:hypothetical protein n=1 Tax=Archangium sp. TaxID=1872627 RepID=UPI002E303549|nr:hypothetical protein [Archangium sp.]HEX5749425.1 hypothetical protein [Archangium sp.]